MSTDHILQTFVQFVTTFVQNQGICVTVQLLKTQSRIIFVQNFIQRCLQHVPYTVDKLAIHGLLNTKLIPTLINLKLTGNALIRAGRMLLFGRLMRL